VALVTWQVGALLYLNNELYMLAWYWYSDAIFGSGLDLDLGVKKELGWKCFADDARIWAHLKQADAASKNTRIFMAVDKTDRHAGAALTIQRHVRSKNELPHRLAQSGRPALTGRPPSTHGHDRTRHSLDATELLDRSHGLKSHESLVEEVGRAHGTPPSHTPWDPTLTSRGGGVPRPWDPTLTHPMGPHPHISWRRCATPTAHNVPQPPSRPLHAGNSAHRRSCVRALHCVMMGVVW
jgi:hypothetical protein